MLSKRGWAGGSDLLNGFNLAFMQRYPVAIITQRVGRCLFAMLGGDGIRRAGPQISVDAPKMWVKDAGFVWELLSVLLLRVGEWSRCLSKHPSEQPQSYSNVVY